MKYFGYVYSKNKDSEIFFNIDKINDLEISNNISNPFEAKKIEYFKKGELLLNFLNGDLNLDEKLKEFIDFNDINRIRDEIKLAVNHIFEYKVNTLTYDYNFKDVIVNNIFFKKYRNNVQVVFDRKIKNINEDNIEPAYDIYVISSIRNLMYFSLKNFIQFENIPIRACKNCGRYFIASTRRDELFCSNLYQNTNKSCKELASNIINMNRIENDEALKLYQKIKDRKRMKATRNKENNDIQKAYKEWLEKSKSIYEKYKKKEIDKSEFIKWLNNNE